MHLFLLGISHRQAPLAVRERFSLSPDAVPAFLKTVSQRADLREAVVLSTCNRFELYAVAERRAAAQAARATLLELFGQPPEAGRHFYVLDGVEAVRHLFRVTAGLDSQVLGETQILGQVREAYSLAQDAASVGKVLHALFNQALASAKRVHTETAVSRRPVSVASVAAAQLREALGGLTGRTVHVWGAGETAADVVAHLADAGARVTVFNRTAARAEALAARFGAAAGRWRARLQALSAAQALVTATAARRPVLREREARAALGGARLFILDLAVPRDVEPAVGRLPGVQLHDLDALQVVLARNLASRQRAARKAERLLEADVAAFSDWVRSLAVVPLIRSLREKAEEIRRAELERALRRLPDLTERQRAVVEQLTATIVNKLLNDPTVRLKELAGDGHEEKYLKAFTELFKLGEEEAGGADAGAGQVASAAAGDAGGAAGGGPLQAGAPRVAGPAEAR
ncbi:MAG: glutamyl-tRNA reductase [Firmicutes bacterium]|nr:glutamyl-tRNA reductase [Bacillota bacterium]